MALSSPQHEPGTSLGDTAWILSSFLTGSHFCAFQHRSNNKVENPEKRNVAQESETWASSWFILGCMLGDFSSWSVCPMTFETVVRDSECLHDQIQWRESHFLVSRKLKREESLGSYYTLPGHTPSDQLESYYPLPGHTPSEPASSHSVKLLKTLPYLNGTMDLDGIRGPLHMNQWGNSYPNLIKQPKDKVQERRKNYIGSCTSEAREVPLQTCFISAGICASFPDEIKKKDRGSRH